VKELWIVDPWAKTLEIFRRSEEAFVRSAFFSGTDTLVTPIFPGLEIPLTEVF
jgi:Uma2 family endonuclease